MAAHATVRTLLATDEVTVGEFVCPPGDGRWACENDIGEGFHVVFPWTPVHIARRAMPELVATPNHAVLYPPRLRFHRRHLTSEGDHCLFVVLGAAMCEQLGLRPGRAGDPALPPTVWLAQRLLAAYLCRPASDAAVAGRLARDLVVTTLRPSPAAASGAGGSAVEHTKELMARSPGRLLPLERIARDAHYSRFHLLRAFHARTGYTMHQYHLHLRLRRSLGPLLAGAPVADIALELGFQGHSHFTARFRRAFGATPSAVRAIASDQAALPGLVERLLAA
ncbi:MAG TPA: AraC family transcriptional regulator [Gaiellales bacterium]|nr:AraC family transcriptional regulator [Gaiellales bacterium]